MPIKFYRSLERKQCVRQEQASLLHITAKKLMPERIEESISSENPGERWETVAYQDLTPAQISRVLREDTNPHVKSAVLLHQKLKMAHIMQALSDKDRYVKETAERLHPIKVIYATVYSQVFRK